MKICSQTNYQMLRLSEKNKLIAVIGFIIAALFSSFFSPGLAASVSANQRDDPSHHQTMTFDQIGSVKSPSEVKVKGVSTTNNRVQLRTDKTALPYWEQIGVEGLGILALMTLIIWLYFRLRYGHKRHELISQLEDNRSQKNGNVGYHLWLIKHLPLGLQTSQSQTDKLQQFSVKDDFLILMFHPLFKKLRYAGLLWVIFSLSLGVLGVQLLSKDVVSILAADSIDDTEAEFNAGDYHNTQWKPASSRMELDSTGLTEGSGYYTSSVKDGGSNASWDNISWVADRPVGKELPNDSNSETAYNTGNADMANNNLLMHLNDDPAYAGDKITGSSAGHNNGVLYTSDSLDKADTGKLGGALQFDGDGDYILIPDADGLDSTRDLTISAWVKPDATNGTIISKKHDAVSTIYTLKLSSGKFLFSTQGTHGETRTYATDDSFSTGQWLHVAAVFTDSNTMQIWVNGENKSVSLIETDGGDYGVLADSLEDLVIGNCKVNELYWDGLIDEVAIWDQSFGSDEIEDLYLRGALRFKVQVRSDTNNPPRGDFLGPDGTNTDYYQWGEINSIDLPDFTLTNVPDNRYFQYRVYFETDAGDRNYSPYLKSVTVSYTSDNDPPDTPTNTSPADGSTDQNLNLTLVCSDYADDESDTQLGAEWQVDNDDDFSSPVWTRSTGAAESTTSVNSTNGTFANELDGKIELDHETEYFWRCRYSDGAWSTWSTATDFFTNAIELPDNITPEDGATLTTLTPLLEASEFLDDQPGHTHQATQWQIDDDDDFSSLTYDSGATDSPEISHAVPNSTLANYKTYYWRVRYQDSSDFWSSYSDPTQFSIQISEAAVEVRPVFGSTTVDQGEEVAIDVQVLNFTDGSPLNSADTTITIYDPSGSKIVEDAEMTYLTGSNGIYRYSYTVPAESGSYLYEAAAAAGEKNGYGAANFEVRTLYTDVEDIKSDVEYIRTQVDSLMTKLNLLEGKIDTVIDNWAGYTAADLIAYVDELETGLGTSSDECDQDDTVFGNLVCLRDKWGTQTADDIYSVCLNSSETIDAVQAELGYNGKTDSAYDDLQTLKGYVDAVEAGIIDLDSDLEEHESAQADERAAQSEERTAQAASRTRVEDVQTKVTTIYSDVSTIKSDVAVIKSDVASNKRAIETVRDDLQKLAGQLPEDYEGVYEQLVEIASVLESLGVIQGSGADSLYSLSSTSRDDVHYLRNKILDLHAAIEINRVLLNAGGQNSVFSTWYTFDSVVLNVIIANPTDRTAKIPFKTYLPKEINQEQIISTGGLQISYEEAAEAYVASGEFELDGGESITRQIEMKDIWQIEQAELDDLRRQISQLSQEADKTAYSAQVTVLENDALMRLDRIERKQNQEAATPQDHILTYRENQEDLEIIKKNIEKMTDLVTSAGAGRGLLASIAGINTFLTWGIILALVTGIVLLGLTFHSMWKHQMELITKLTGSSSVDKAASSNEKQAQKSKTAAVASMAKASKNLLLEKQMLWQWLKKLLLLVMLLLGLFMVVKLLNRSKPWESLKFSQLLPAQQPSPTAAPTAQPTAEPTPTPTPTLQKVKVLPTATGWLNVRRGPGTEFEQIDRVDVDQILEKLDEQTSQTEEIWVQVRISDDQTSGWVHGDYIIEVDND